MNEDTRGAEQFQIDGIPFRLRQWADLSWIGGYGRVFQVMDQLTSGNLCFGVEGPYGRLFIKFAGAETVNCAGTAEDAVRWLQRGAQLYQRCAHPCLIPMLTHGAVNGGYATVFPWRDAPPLRPDPPTDAVRAEVRALPLIRQLAMLDGIFDLHALLAANGLVAVDFTDEHVLIDFSGMQALVCDIDMYKDQPAFNTRGRMPGSPRFLAPEEYEMGNWLGEDTTVYKLGALAFEFFGENYERSAELWLGPRQLYPVAERATRERRQDRYATVKEFLTAWRNTVSGLKL